MTNASAPGNAPEPNPPQQPQPNPPRRSRAQRLGILAGILLLVGLTGGITWTWIFIQRMLAPMVEKSVTRLLNRPVEMGQVERVYLNGLRFGASKLPPTPTDPDRGAVEAVDVVYNPLKLLWNRKLELDVTLVNPEVYIEQDQEGKWVELEIQKLPKGAIEIELQVLRVRDADVKLVGRSEKGTVQPAVVAVVPRGKSEFLDDNRRIRFDGVGQLASGGKFNLKGEYLSPIGQTKLQLAGQNLSALEIGRLLPLPLKLQAGKVGGNLEVQIQREKPLQFLGVATLNQVTARLPALPQPFAKTNGRLRFKGTQVRLEKVTTQFGQIPAEANGTLDTQTEFNLLARTQPVEVKQVLQTFKIDKAPVVIAGKVQAALKITGPLAKPVVTGEATTVETFRQKVATRIDRVNFRAISAGFQLDTAQGTASGPILAVNNLRAIPTVGGVVTGQGVIQLGEAGGLRFNLQADRIPADAIAKTYGVNLPVAIGPVSARGQIFGPLNNARNLRATGSATAPVAGGTVTATNLQFLNRTIFAQVQAQNVRLERLAQVPPQFQGPVTGQFNVAVNLDNFKPSEIGGSGSAVLNLAGGTIVANNIQLTQGRWQADVESRGVQLGRLFPQIPPSLQAPVSGRFALSGSLENLSLAAIQGRGSGSMNVAGGTVAARDAKLGGGRWQAIIQAVGVQLGRLVPQLPAQLQSPFTGTFNAAGSLTNFSPKALEVSGNGLLNVGGGTVRVSNMQLDEGRWRANVQANGVQLAGLAPQLPPQFAGQLTGAFNLSGSLDNLALAAITGSGSGQLDVGDGTVRAADVQLAGGRWRANLQTDGVELAQLTPQLPPQFAGRLAGRFNLSGSLDNLALAAITGSGSGQLNVGDGTLRASDVQLAAGRWQANLQAARVQLTELLPQLPAQFSGPFEGNFDLSGNLAQLSLNGIEGRGRGSWNVAGGTLTATNVQLNNGNVQAVLESQGIELARLSETLRGSLDGRLDVTGSLASLNPVAIGQSWRAEGQLNFSEGLALVNRPLSTSLRWTGTGVEIQQATASGLSASGFVGVNVAKLTRQPGVGAITNFNLDVAADDLNLQELSAYLPRAADLRVAGLADFDGTIKGTIAAPNVQGDLQLENFAVDGLAFEPVLSGQVSTVPGEQLQLDLKGNNDRIALALSPDYRPVSFNIQQGEAIATGRRQGELLAINTQNFPISIIKELTPVPAAIATQPLSGEVSGDLAVNLNTFDVTVNQLAITGPIFNPRRGDGSQPGNNQYLLSGRVIQTRNGPEFQGQLDIVEGQLGVLVALWQLFDVNQVSPRLNAPLDVAQVGLPEAPLQVQLRRLSEIEALLERRQEERAQASPLGELSELDGTFTGSVTVAASMASGINAEFNIKGADWTWNTFKADQVVAKGSFQDGVLTLLPVRVQSEDSLAVFSGTIGGDTQSGQLRLENVPVALIQEFVTLPPAVGFGGQINATATLAGSLTNPQARGEVTVVDASLNQQQVQAARGSFSYNNARLNFSAESILAAEAEPLTIAGSVPYKLPLPDAVAPKSNELTLDINVKDKGLALLNILSRQQIAWVDGTGDVNVKINGIIDPESRRPQELTAQGQATVNNATIESVALPEPLKEVNGDIEFNFDRINVKNLSGTYGGGQVKAVGTIPISDPIPQPQPLMVDIGELALNLKGRYTGSVKGNVVLTGAALNPTIGGQIELFNGRVPLPDQAAAGGSSEESSDSGIPIEFNNLQITLGKDIQIRKAPILNFLARGMLTVNGSLSDLEPKGEIDLVRGQVNLFTTQFRLARGYDNTAIFRPERGLDPELDVRLIASVAEATQRRLPTSPQSAEILDAPEIGFGSVQTVRVQARVEGPASQLADRLELTSTPARSEAEIVALLGGGFVDTLGRGDSTLGLANLAGSALLGNVSNTIGDALGLTEFRLFPTIITNDERRTSSLGLAAEAGIDISRNFSVSVTKELTTDQPPQYNLRYRLNENVLLRGGTDFSGDSRAVIEYERRF
ncbi:MAG TPA: hypothetical protein DDZ80_00255 [Cyanobacteria bacterium UBA8803]|nr:hypothetical protein [Cyanobacteria bacterium UBA8803]